MGVHASVTGVIHRDVKPENVSSCAAGHEAIWGSLATGDERAAWEAEHAGCAAPAPPRREPGEPGPRAFALAAQLVGAGFDVEPYGERGVVARSEREAVRLAELLRARGFVVVRTSAIVVVLG